MDIGYSALLVALVASVASFLMFIRAAMRRDEESFKLARITAAAQTLFLTAAVLILLYYFLARDFNVAYVAQYSDRSLSLEYTIGALWGGAAGSLLLWAWILSLFMLGISLWERKDQMTSYALAVMSSVNIFFIVIMGSLSDPFVRLDFIPQDGSGLNPLLINPGMLIHPPTLFVGYAGLTVPFAFALGGLLSESELWIFRMRKWTLFSWLFLGLGIFFGGWWSYTVLGWGGYWAWDPVENSSLVPWLISSALLHSVMLQETRRGMKLWNVTLSIATFEAVILATFLTRSGVISSVHSFGESNIGPFFTLYMGFMLAASLGILALKFDQVRSMNIFESALGREASFLLNNLLFVVAGTTVAWGTLFPLLNEAVVGTKMNVGPQFYNQIASPVILILALLMGVCITLSWGRTDTGELTRRLRYPSVMALAVAPPLYLVGFHDVWSILGFSAATFAITIHVEDFLLDARNTGRKRQIGFGRALMVALLNRRRRYGGYIIHLSMFLIFIGLIGTTFYQSTYPATLEKGRPAQIRDYTFTYEGVNVDEGQAETDYVIHLSVANGNFNSQIKPRLSESHRDQSTIVHVGVLSLPLEDIYIIPQEVKGDQVSIRINYVPLINFIWAGGSIMVIGVIIGLLPRWRKDKGESE